MRRTRYFSYFLLLTCLALSACAIPVHLTRGNWMPGKAIDSNRSALLMRVPDAIEPGEGRAGGSGQELTQQLLEGLLRRNVKVTVSDETAVSAAVVASQRMGYRYVLRVVFTDWADNATAWSGNPDRAGASAEFYDGTNGELVASFTHMVKASGASLVGSSPDRFYPELVTVLMDAVFGQSVASGKSSPARN